VQCVHVSCHLPICRCCVYLGSTSNTLGCKRSPSARSRNVQQCGWADASQLDHTMLCRSAIRRVMILLHHPARGNDGAANSNGAGVRKVQRLPATRNLSHSHRAVTVWRPALSMAATLPPVTSLPASSAGLWCNKLKWDAGVHRCSAVPNDRLPGAASARKLQHACVIWRCLGVSGAVSAAAGELVVF
jgi:hypothetical protein